MLLDINNNAFHEMLMHMSWKNLRGIMLMKRGQEGYVLRFHLDDPPQQANVTQHDGNQRSACLREWWVGLSGKGHMGTL